MKWKLGLHRVIYVGNTPGFEAWVTGWGCRGFVKRGTRCRGGVGCRALGF